MLVAGLPESRDNSIAEPNLKFRASQNWITPYIELEINKSWINEIVVGPSLYQDHLAHSINIFWKSKFKEDIRDKIKKSNIPFRD